KFKALKKRLLIAKVVFARELAGWCWSLAAPLERKDPKGSPVKGRTFAYQWFCGLAAWWNP
ncbi:MAG: hypothetical protein L0H61_08950, partial [Micrococcaceae bacterium]|nr:hypothetical protein [Micrococcaceae bacterium]